MTYPQLYSGVALNQNKPSDSPTSFPFNGFVLYQTFQMPADFPRGTVYPPLTGFQFLVRINADAQAGASLGWSLDHLTYNGWKVIQTGTQVGSPWDGQVWMTAFFDEPIDISQFFVNATPTFRLVITALTGLDTIYYTLPNPLSTGQAFQLSGTIGGHSINPGPILENGQAISFMFRILAGIADSGVDFLGNIYRSLAVSSSAPNVNPAKTV